MADYKSFYFSKVKTDFIFSLKVKRETPEPKSKLEVFQDKESELDTIFQYKDQGIKVVLYVGVLLKMITKFKLPLR